ncbi:MAG: hypothetical protein Aurels2KO_08550 [Aureliella sp.]
MNAPTKPAHSPSGSQPAEISIDQLPSDFTLPATKYRRQAWLALSALIAFGVIYLSLATWFTYTSYRLLSGLSAGNNALVALAGGIPAGFLAVFMWKALFFKGHKADKHLVELSSDDEPDLFAFVYDLADRLKAPRPHRVFVSAEVNAAVFYDLTLFNFIIPTKKNLIIGLGLVNALNRHELEAVLAHEFGHFAQKSMAVGRWASFAEQIARQVVNKRDALDSFLMAISHIDIRIAWVGWIMRTIVWSIRSLIETLFGWVIVLQRALSREMEFQADLVAVSATGSDAIINGLYRCQAADEDWQQSLSFAEEQAANKKKIVDIYAIQSRASELLARIMNEPDRGSVPPVENDQRATRRIFTRQLAQPPKMWSTHPSNVDREENAKRVFVTAPTDERPAWTIFRDPAELRQKITAHLLEELPEDFKPQPLDESLDKLNKRFQQTAFDARYQGLYLGRRVGLAAMSPTEMFGQQPSRDQLPAKMEGLYDEELQSLIERSRNLSEHANALEAIQLGVSDASSESYDYAGETFTHRQLPKLVERVKHDADAVKKELSSRDQEIRTTFNTAAKYIGKGWQEYHTGLASLLHYAEHSEADLQDAMGHFSHTLSIATATGHVSGGKLKKLLASADNLHNAMHKIDSHATSIVLPESLVEEFEGVNWREKLPKVELPGPSQENIGQWVEVVGSWAESVLAALSELRQATLNQLLQTEEQISELFSQTDDVADAPKPPQTPEFYALRPPGSERKRQKKLDWLARFALADGVVPMVLRTGVAASILGGVIAAGMMTGRASVVIYNGLRTAVLVKIDGNEVQLRAGAHKRLSLPASIDTPIQAWAGENLIEEFLPDADGSFRTYVYNVAAAAPLIQWTAVYGSQSPREPRVIGFQRWVNARTDFVFEEPPESLETTSSGTTRTVLDQAPDMLPFQTVALAKTEVTQTAVVREHVLWDDADSTDYSNWLRIAASIPTGFSILQERIEWDPHNTPVLRMMQETVPDSDRESLLEQHRQLGIAHPDDANMNYIAIRAMDEGSEQDDAFLKAANSWPENMYLAHAAAYVQCGQQDWKGASDRFDVVLSTRNPMFDAAAVEAARIRRLLAYPEKPDLRDLMQSSLFKMLYDIEIGQGLRGSPMEAFSMIRRREFLAAHRIATQGDGGPDVLVLLAASDEAAAEWIEEALKLPVEELDDVAMLYYLAVIAKKSGQDFDKYMDAAMSIIGPKELTFHRSVAEVIRTDAAEDLQPHLMGLPTARQGLLYALATMFRGDDAPQQWRNASQAMLFANEGPAL